MDIIKIKNSVVSAGKRLLNEGFVERTWGNVSARISCGSFAVTPSGCAYDSVSEENIVTVGITDLKYTGTVKPSSESAIHAFIYKHYPEVNFIIHTHQKFASVLSTARRNIPVPKEYEHLIGSVIPVADYAEAGTTEIALSIIKALSCNNTNAVLMPCHGAVCFGKNAEAAFETAAVLEVLSEKILETELPILKSFREKNKEIQPLINFYASERSGDCCTVFDSQTGNVLCKTDIRTGERFCGDCGFLPDLHRQIYSSKPEINFIFQGAQPVLLCLSEMLEEKSKLPPYFDDFAQIAGEEILVTDFSKDGTAESMKKIIGGLEGRNAVIIPGSGMLCCGETSEDAFSVLSISEKNALAAMLASKKDSLKPLPREIACKLRSSYIKKYSKMIGTLK